jgi:translation initiation factor IF-1
MAKTENVTLTGKVTESCKGGIFIVQVNNNDSILTVVTKTSGKIKQNNITITVGDVVEIEVSPYDFTKGRITRRK